MARPTIRPTVVQRGKPSAPGGRDALDDGQTVELRATGWNTVETVPRVYREQSGALTAEEQFQNGAP